MTIARALLSFLPLASTACHTESSEAPAPAVATAPVDQVDLSSLAGKSVSVEEFVKACQQPSGLNFTYTKDTQAALAAASMCLDGDGHIARADFERFLAAELAKTGFECHRIGPEHTRVVLIERRKS